MIDKLIKNWEQSVQAYDVTLAENITIISL